jgi:hypothetical protein
MFCFPLQTGASVMSGSISKEVTQGPPFQTMAPTRFANFKSHHDYTKIVTSLDHREALGLIPIIRREAREGSLFLCSKYVFYRSHAQHIMQMRFVTS